MINKKGNVLAIISIVVASIVIVVFLAGWVYFFNILNTTMLHINLDTNIVNLTAATEKTISPINNAMTGLNYISFILIIMLMVSSIIENYYVRKHPILMAVHLLFVIFGVIASIYISNTFESLLGNSILSSQLAQQSGSAFIILNLPYIIAVVGLIGFGVMFINLNRDPEMKANEI